MFLAILATLLTAVFLYWLIFDDVHEFIESVKYWLMPDIISLIRGEFDKDWWAEFKLFIWLGVSILNGVVVYYKFT